MKFSVRVNEFKRVLEEARVVVPAEIAPHFEQIKVEVLSESQATISGAAPGLSIVQHLEVIDAEVGALLLPAKCTQDFLKPYTGGTATIETTTDEHVVVKVGAFTMKVKGMNVAFFMPLESMPTATHTISTKFLKRLISRVNRVCPSKGGRTGSSTIKVESDGTKLRAVATDGYRIAVADAQGDWGTFSIQLPQAMLRVLARRAGATIQFSESQDSYFFKTEGVLLQCRKPRTKVPDFERVLAREHTFDTAIRMAGADLKAAIANILGIKPPKEKFPAIVLESLGESVCVSAQFVNDSATGCVNALIEGRSEGRIRFNANYVLDFLLAVDGDISFQFNGKHGPAKFSTEDGYQYFVMPLTPEGSSADKSPSGGSNDRKAACHPFMEENSI
jgi:DNA polymerase-3 subunit beta